MKHFPALATTLALSLFPLASASAQAGTGGFQAGDMYLYTSALDALSGGGAVVRIDPGTGQTEFFLDLLTASTARGSMCYEPYRDRLVFYGGFQLNHQELYTCDAAGNLQSLGFVKSSGASIQYMAPRGDGKIYCVWYGNSLRFSYLDENDAMQTLLDATGQPYTATSPAGAHAMFYDEPTNQLIVSEHSNISECPGEFSGASNVFFLQLSGDGTRVLSETCASFDASPIKLNERCEGMAAGPDGDVIMVVSTEGSGFGERIARIDPGAGTVTTFASTDYTGAGILRGGTYSPYLGKAVYMDPYFDVIRAHGPGEGGGGTILATAGVSYPGISSEIVTLVSVVPTAPLTGLTCDTTEVSLSAGGTQVLTTDFGLAHAGRIYLVLGSASGWTPGLPAGTQHLALNFDNYLLYTLFTPNGAPLASSLGLLDVNGRATTTFTLPPASDAGLAGAVLHHASSALDFAYVTQRTSNPVPVALMP